MIQVGVFGAAGRMGSEVCRAVEAADDLQLVASIDVQADGQSKDISTEPEAMNKAGAKVAVDFTVASSAVSNIEWCLAHGIHVVVGTTGLPAVDLEKIRGLAEGSKANVLIAPNFAIGAVLMMHFAQQAAAWLPDVEIIELHHDAKLDSPSGTSLKTAEAIARGRASDPQAPSRQSGAKQVIPGARGAEADAVRIHSVRLPGLVAHQEVVFGGAGQTLTIRHDSIDRTSFMPGVLLAIRRIADLPGLTIGLEAALELK